MDKYEIADKLEKSILDRVNELLVSLPNYITIENEDTFVSVCDKIEKITVDAFDEAKSLGCRDIFSGWRRILTPWWKNSYNKFEYAYGEGFTWKQFLDYIIESNCDKVEVSKEQNLPTISFSNEDGDIKFNVFYIELSTED